MWVNCFGVIAPVHAWSFASSLFDTRQAKRLFGLIGSGASLGAIVGGFLARVLVGPIGGSINLMLVLVLLIALGAVVVTAANMRIRRRGALRLGRPATEPLWDTVRTIMGRPYLRLIAAVVLLTAIVTQWTGLQLSLVTSAAFNRDAAALTRFNGTFTLALGIVSFIVQIFVTSQALRRFGLALTILALPLSLGFGTALIVLLPAFWPVLVTNAFDQGLRFSVDRPTYELLYLPITPSERLPIKSAIDIVGSRVADAVGAVIYGLADRRVLRSRSRPQPARNRGRQRPPDRRMGRRRLAVARRLRPHDSGQHPSPSHGYGTDVVDRPRAVGCRRAARQAGGRAIPARCATPSACSKASAPRAGTRRCGRCSIIRRRTSGSGPWPCWPRPATGGSPRRQSSCCAIRI